MLAARNHPEGLKYILLVLTEIENNFKGICRACFLTEPTNLALAFYYPMQVH